MTDYSQVAVVVLAAGQGKRINSVDIPKVMREIGGKPMVSYTVSTLKSLGLKPEQICLVVGFCKEKVIEFFGKEVSYAVQEERLGTAHAAFIGMSALPASVRQVMVMGGDDSAFYTKETLEKLFEKHLASEAKLTLLTAHPKNYQNLGRIVRHADGKVEIIEKEYLTDEQKKITEISTGTFVFDRAWYQDIFPKMPKLRKLGEYGLPTAFAMARDNGEKIEIMELSDPDEWFGVNTPEELAEADKRKRVESSK